MPWGALSCCQGTRHFLLCQNQPRSWVPPKCGSSGDAWGVGWGCPFPRTLDTPEGPSPCHPEPSVGLPGPPGLSGTHPSGAIPEWTPSSKEAHQTPKLQDHRAPSCSWESTPPVPGSTPGYSHPPPLPLLFSLLERPLRTTPCLGPPPSLLPCVSTYRWMPPQALQLAQPPPLPRWVVDHVLNLQRLGRVTLASLRESVLTVSGIGQRGCPVCRGQWGHSLWDMGGPRLSL